MLDSAFKANIVKGCFKAEFGLSVAFTWSTTILFQSGFSTAYWFFINKLHDTYGITAVLFSLQKMVKWAVLSLKLLEADRDSCALFCFAVSPAL